MAASLPVSLVAAEDQSFAAHHGFDLAAIEKAQAHNKRMTARAERPPLVAMISVRPPAIAVTKPVESTSTTASSVARQTVFRPSAPRATRATRAGR